MLVRVVPFLGMGLLAGMFGYNLAGLVPASGRVYLQIAFLTLLFSLLILDREPVWNIVLYICFGITAGMVLSWTGGGLFRLRSWVLFWGLLIISLIGGAYSKGTSRGTRVTLISSTLFYLTGWILLAIFQLPHLAGMIWIVLGLALFALVLAAVVTQGKDQNAEDSAIPLSIQLFVVIFNLFWLTGLLQV